MYSKLFNKIYNVASISNNKDETWVSLLLAGQYKQQYSKTLFSELYKAFEELGKEGCITFKIGNASLSIDELQDSLVEDAQWSLNINKQAFMGDGDEICNFFYDLDAFKHWAGLTDPFSVSNPFNSHKCKVIVNGLSSPFGGPNFLVSGNVGDIPDNKQLVYNHDYLKSVLRQFTETKKEVCPEKHYVSFGEVNEYSAPFYRNSLKCLSVALCDELYEDKIVLRGLRRLEFDLGSPTYDHGRMAQEQASLCEAFCWVFDKDSRYELRHKLLMDRLTLDMPIKKSYYEGVVALVDHALRQAKERYNYAFLERSDEHQRELQQFLKELQGLCDSYSSKVRTLLSNFLRDALAGFLTVAITIFAQVGDLEKLDSGKVLTYIFCLYGVYLLVSCIFQTIVDWRDLNLSENEIDYWKKVSREYMSGEDFDSHKKGTIERRKKWAIRQYIYMAVLYVVLAGFSFNMPRLWNRLSLSVPKTELTEEQNNTESEIEKTIVIDIINNGENTVSRDDDTTMRHSPCGE